MYVIKCILGNNSNALLVQTPTAHPTRRTMFPSGGTFLYLLRPQRNKAKKAKKKQNKISTRMNKTVFITKQLANQKKKNQGNKKITKCKFIIVKNIKMLNIKKKLLNKKKLI